MSDVYVYRNITIPVFYCQGKAKDCPGNRILVDKDGFWSYNDRRNKQREQVPSWKEERAGLIAIMRSLCFFLLLLLSAWAWEVIVYIIISSV